MVFVLVFSTQAFAKWKRYKPILPDIPKTWTEVDPEEVYPDFTYNGLEPACASCPPTMDPTTGEVTMYDPKFTFFVKGGKINNLVIYFQGGGACWDSMNCLYAHTYYEEVPPIEMFYDTEGKGIFDTSNGANPFKNWYMVYIPYCTGDVHWGANDKKYPYGGGTATIKHRGFVNFQVVLRWIEDNFSRPRSIFVSGSSAGSYGAIMGFPYIKEAFPWSRVSVLGDAGNGVTGGNFQTESINNWNIQLPQWVPGFEGGYDETMSMDFVYVSIAKAYPFSKLAQFTTAWDWNQTFFYNVMLNIHDPSLWGIPPDYPYWMNEWCSWHQQMLDFVWNTAAEAPNYRHYIAAGQYHTIMMSPQFYTEDSAGIPFAKWVKAMVRNPFGMWGGPMQGRWKNVECVDCEDPMTCP
jgi:hypothetical protein